VFDCPLLYYRGHRAAYADLTWILRHLDLAIFRAPLTPCEGHTPHSPSPTISAPSNDPKHNTAPKCHYLSVSNLRLSVNRRGVSASFRGAIFCVASRISYLLAPRRCPRAFLRLCRCPHPPHHQAAMLSLHVLSLASCLPCLTDHFLSFYLI
jgi:hypothetical protein